MVAFGLEKLVLIFPIPFSFYGADFLVLQLDFFDGFLLYHQTQVWTVKGIKLLHNVRASTTSSCTFEYQGYASVTHPGLNNAEKGW